MSLRHWITVLTCLLLATAGCTKAVVPEPVLPLPLPPPVAEAERPTPPAAEDPEIPEEYQREFRNASAAVALPDFFLLLADRFAGRGDRAGALRFFDRAAGGFAEAENQAGEASAWSGKVLLLLDAGREGEASSLLAEGVARWREPPFRAFPRYLAGRQALTDGNFARALELLRHALLDNGPLPQDPHLLRLRRDTELAAGAASILSVRLSGLLRAYGAPETSGAVPEPGGGGEGEGHLLRVLDLNRALRQTKIAPFLSEAEFQRREAEAQGFLGLEAGSGGRTKESMDRFTRALELSRSAGFHEGEIRTLLFLGELGLQKGDAEEGLRAAREFLDLADRLHSDPYRIWSRLLLARHHRGRGRTVEAIEFLREADRLLSNWRKAPEAEMFQKICRVQRRALYGWLIEWLSAERRFAEALVFAEKARARGLVDLLAGEELGRSTAEREQLRQAAGLEAQIRGLQRLILKGPRREASGDIRERLEATEREHRRLLDRIGEGDGELLSLLAVREIDPAALQLLLDQDTTLFAYFVADERTYVWAIHRTNIHLERIELPRSELRALVFSFSDAIRGKNRKNTEALSRRAYDLLLKPIIPFVSGERIGFIPDDALAYLPFSALNYRGSFLAEGFAVFQLSSLRLLRRPVGDAGRQPPNILVFVDPEQEGGTSIIQRAIGEMEIVRRRTGHATVLLDHPATARDVGEMAAGYGLLHFAVPAEFSPGSPLDSALRLSTAASGGGRLGVRDLLALRLKTEAVVMSGCDPRKESDPEGLGMGILQEAFLHAGSRSVVTNLWPVHDRGVARLLGLFYGRIGRGGFPADSLRAAQLDAIREGHPPHLWAAFALAGY